MTSLRAVLARPQRGNSDRGVVHDPFKVNGAQHTLRLEPRVSLLDCPRGDLHLTVTKKGCDHGQCGACAALVNGRLVNSCLSFAAMHEGGLQKVYTSENLPKIYRTNPQDHNAKVDEHRPPLSDNRATYAGQYVGRVVEKTMDQARAAAAAVQMSYEEETPNTSWDLADGLVESKLKRTGRGLNANLADYIVTTNPDCLEIDITFTDNPDFVANSYGAKGCGEIGLAGVATAITAAIDHATGLRMRELPVRIEDLLKAPVPHFATVLAMYQERLVAPFLGTTPYLESSVARVNTATLSAAAGTRGVGS